MIPPDSGAPTPHVPVHSALHQRTSTAIGDRASRAGTGGRDQRPPDPRGTSAAGVLSRPGPGGGADPQKLAEQETLVRKVIVQRGGRLNDVLQRLHLDEQSFRDVLSLPLAWDAYVRGAVTEQQIRRDWDAHQPELDGTRLRAAQIVRILPADASAADWEAAESLLRGLRERILAGKPSFAEAAREFSQSPSGQKGGDLGEFGYQGRVDEAISKAAFELKPGEISAPFRSRSGVHIVQLQERIPGQLSLEDARPEILERLSRKLWDEQVRQLREHASVQILEPDAK
jgi:hypothetical protein